MGGEINLSAKGKKVSTKTAKADEVSKNAVTITPVSETKVSDSVGAYVFK